VGAVSPALIALETQDIAAASRMLGLWVADPLELSTNALFTTLGGCAAMAGTDPAGTAWAESYDRAAAAGLTAAQDVVQAVNKLAAMFAQTARNYAAADEASTASTRRLIDAAVATLPRIGDYFLPACTPPSAAGGSSGGPHGWGLVEHLVGYVWPNGHQDRLRTAARAWRTSSDALRHGADDAISASQLAISDRLPESEDMWTVCRAMSGQLSALADVHRSIADSCDALATQLDEVHSAIEGELISLIEWTIGIEVGGGLLSIVTLGLAEGPTQAVEAARIAKTAQRVAELIEKFIALARTTAQSVAAVAERAGQVSVRLRAVLDARLSEAAVTVVGRIRTVRATGDLGAIGRIERGAELPQLAVSLPQLESKFKHARDFGVRAPRGRAGFDEFRAALGDFLHRPSTTRIAGMYRGERVVLNYNIETRLVVVQRTSGEFVSGWLMTPEQLQRVRAVRRLGGG
jgi:hypothetical protein